MDNSHQTIHVASILAARKHCCEKSRAEGRENRGFVKTDIRPLRSLKDRDDDYAW
jgi:hypothetical protein